MVTLKSGCEVNGAFVDRIVTGRTLLPQVVAEVMQEVAQDVLIPIMQQAAPWLPDGTEGPPDEDRKSWVVTGMSRDFVAFVPGYIEPVMHFASFTDEFHHDHEVNQALLEQASAGAGAATGQVRLVVARYAAYTPYLQAMERGEIKGFGRGEGPPDAWDRMSPAPVEQVVFQENTATFWAVVMARIKERMIMYTGARGGFIW